jgi:hypothetical protein
MLTGVLSWAWVWSGDAGSRLLFGVDGFASLPIVRTRA